MKARNIMKTICAITLTGIIAVSTGIFTHGTVYAINNATKPEKQTFTIDDITTKTKDFIEIEKYIHYDPKTNIVWIRYVTRGANQYTPYIAPNGLPFKYDPQTNTFYMITSEDYTGEAPAKDE